jgi:hypothetical protein
MRRVDDSKTRARGRTPDVRARPQSGPTQLPEPPPRDELEPAMYGAPHERAHSSFVAGRGPSAVPWHVALICRCGAAAFDHEPRLVLRSLPLRIPPNCEAFGIVCHIWRRRSGWHGANDDALRRTRSTCTKGIASGSVRRSSENCVTRGGKQKQDRTESAFLKRTMVRPLSISLPTFGALAAERGPLRCSRWRRRSAPRLDRTVWLRWSWPSARPRLDGGGDNYDSAVDGSRGSK